MQTLKKPTYKFRAVSPDGDRTPYTLWLTADELAKFLRVKKDQVYRAAKKNIKLGTIYSGDPETVRIERKYVLKEEWENG